MVKHSFYLLLLMSTLWLSGCADTQPEIITLQGQTMGTGYTIKVYTAQAVEQDALHASIKARLETIDALMSSYRDDSALMRFNHNQSTDWQPAPIELVELTAQSQTISEHSLGHFDITVAPLVNLWGFGNTDSAAAVPPDSVIEETLAYTGYQKLSVRTDPPALRKQHGRLQIDLSAIAKGWGVDQLAQLLADQGIEHYLVDIGGELRASGNKPDGSPWRIAIERPLRNGREMQHVVALHDHAMATSGDYRNYFQQDGHYFSHMLDPQSGRPVRHQLASVSVLAAQCATADAWATALMALGEKKGPAIAEQLGLKAFFIIRTEKGFEELATPAFSNFTARETRT